VDSVVDTKKVVRGQSNHTKMPLPLERMNWTNVHRDAYIQALAVAKAKQLLKPIKGRAVPSNLFSNVTTPSFVFSYYAQPHHRKLTKPEGLKSILGDTNIYDYYPKQQTLGEPSKRK